MLDTMMRDGAGMAAASIASYDRPDHRDRLKINHAVYDSPRHTFTAACPSTAVWRRLRDDAGGDGGPQRLSLEQGTPE